MKRLHIVGRKNHGKTTLVVELVEDLGKRGFRIGTIKHTHHLHELDTPGKDSYRHRAAGAVIVGILCPSMSAIFFPHENSLHHERSKYDLFETSMLQCDLVLVEGDSSTSAPRIEVWRSVMGDLPFAATDPNIDLVVTDDPTDVPSQTTGRSDIGPLLEWIISNII